MSRLALLPDDIKLQELKKHVKRAALNGMSCDFCHRAMVIEKNEYWGICYKCPKYNTKDDVVKAIETKVPMWWVNCPICRSRKLSIYQDRCMKHK